jgi:hypothetical protein
MIDTTKPPYNVSASAADNYAGILLAMQQTQYTEEPILLPPGVLNVSQVFPTFAGNGLHFQGQRTTLKYVGSSNTGAVLTFSDLQHLNMQEVSVDANALAAQCVNVSVGAGGGWTPSQYTLSEWVRK